ncbi:plasmid partitioning protein, partial [Rhizobium sp. CCGE 510]
GTEDFLLCLSRPSLEAAAREANVQPRARVRETRAALVDHFASTEAAFVLPAAVFAPNPKDIADLLKHGDPLDEEVEVATGDAGGDVQPDANGDADGPDEASDQVESAYGIAAE